MSSTLFDVIGSALQQLHSQDETVQYEVLENLVMFLRDVKIFALSARKSRDAANVAFFLVKIEDCVCRISKNIHTFHSSGDGFSSTDDRHQAIQEPERSVTDLGREDEIPQRVEDFINYVVVDNILDLVSASYSSIMKEINSIKSEIQKRPEHKVEELTATHSHIQSAVPSMATKEVVGFNDEAKSIKREAPLGIKEVDDCSRCRKKVLMDLLSQDAPGDYSKMSVYDIGDRLRRSLKKKPYLIFLDDVWEGGVLESLQEFFLDDLQGSRILVTSHHHDVAPEPHILRQLNKEESLDLLGRRLFRRNVWSSELNDLKSDILELNYRHLPEHLKPCFLYLASFEEDEQISVKSLLQLWMAEGFVRETQEKRPLEVAETYLNDLIRRSLVMVGEQKYDGKAKTCRVHDLLHELCLRKAKDEQLFHFLGGQYNVLSAFDEPLYRWRLCFCSGITDFTSAKVLYPRVYSLHFKHFEERPSMQNISFMMHFSKLRVLNLVKTRFDKIPSSIGLLVRLTYLAIQCSERYIPSKISELSNLETFILRVIGQKEVYLQSGFLKLQRLKNLHVIKSWGILPINFLDSTSNLIHLDKMSGVKITDFEEDNMESLMKKFPNIRRLRCEFEVSGGRRAETLEIVFPELLSQLESLEVSVFRPHGPFRGWVDFGLPLNLRKITLKEFHVSSRSLPAIDDTWRMDENEFSKQRFLRLDFYLLRSWSGDYGQLECLEKLELENCWSFEELPSCLENCPMLQMIDVRIVGEDTPY
ncbi:OLC1v1020550C1 [Oldenlandia corymbosa var. corymbosa]|uniref:OLC1v1020550C1 n=1 Tax=Oldenlandia corymbosa var. corymbosa TaxID=529605 RepID=A0AAV1EGV5_OLDCO|nr:OLC1v1020550C1 [Oldenlandia corymbosa var. corymbosa]